ncbi:MAG: hypothetical protein KJO84_00835 [Acidimicrobiia bacterium]|nr:hypothetical protein [Acidimicrobiia bacterium]
MSVDATYYEQLLRPAYEGVKFIVPLEVLAGSGPLLDVLAEWGAQPPFVLGGSPGTGEIPEFDPERFAMLDTSGGTMLEAIRAFFDAIHDLPDDVVAKIDRWDPDREAVALGFWLDTDLPVAGRPQYGARPVEWAALEDKMTVDALWDEIGITRAASDIVSVDEGAALEAASRLDRGMGTVWVADNRDGWHGGGEFLRWVRHPNDVGEALSFFSTCADRIRVMPFLDGIPCSIHGMAFPDGEVIAFRPNEMIVFRVPGSSELKYASVANFWEPRPDDAEYMRDVARRTAAHLHESLGYRGVVTIDGVVTDVGFLPTELNPRMGVGLAPVARAADVPMGSLHRSVTHGDPFDYRPHELEDLLMAASESDRRAFGRTVVFEPYEDNVEVSLVYDDEGVPTVTEDADTRHAAMAMGPAAAGRSISVQFEPGGAPIGPPLAPRIAAAFSLADELWGAGIGPLEAAPDLRPSA